MSSGLPYLNKLRKPELVEIAEKTDLQEYDEYNKGELVAALDKHLSDNRAIFSTDSSLSEFYTRLAGTNRRGSPVKREARVEVSPLLEKKTPKTPVLEKKTPGRRSTKTKEEPIESDDAAVTPAPKKTPASASRSTVRSVRSVVSESASAYLPPSPAVVTDAIDQQTTKMREGLESAWTASGIIERSHWLRSNLSSLKAVETTFVLLETGFILAELVPMRYLTTTPAVPAVSLPAISLRVPDLFVLLTANFWAPFMLWFVTNLGLPLVAAYFINLSWQAAASSQGPLRRQRQAAEHASFDPLTFNIVKALLAYEVYAHHWDYASLFSPYSIKKANFAIPGQWKAVLTGNAIGVIGTLYEAILRRS
ncbi:hypothetical protein N7488_000045 [Penicillium malachiteum]|nr:hypothetical protein N7488_000045 [Penicillium malachiteum]